MPVCFDPPPREGAIANLRGTNLNLLPILRELLRKRNVTHAASALNMSQPAVSEALKRLRVIFRDEILVAEGRTHILTSFAERLAPQLEETLGQVELLVLQEAFDPASASGTIKIATADYVSFLLGPKLSGRLASEAPDLSLEFTEANPDSDRDLRMGQVDLIIMPRGLARPALEEFRSMPLFEDRMVYVVSDQSPPGLDLERISSSRYAVFSSFGSLTSSFGATLLQRMGAQHFDAVRLPNFLSIPFMVEGTTNIALVQKRLAARLLPAARIRIEEPPFDTPRLEVIAAWSNAKQHDPMHSWFRRVLSEVAAMLD